jgi:site-specific recombinase XerD
MTDDRYPKQDAMFKPDLAARFDLFADIREDFLLGFGYNTARAYWADLDDLLFWAAEAGLDPLALTEGHIKSYMRVLTERGYSSSTLRRRRTAFRGFYEVVRQRGIRGDWPT